MRGLQEKRADSVYLVLFTNIQIWFVFITCVVSFFADGDFVIIETYELCAQTFFLRALPQNYAPIRATEQEEGGGSVRRLIL